MVLRKEKMTTNTFTPQDIFYNIVRYQVPEFQRTYIWAQDEQWEPLWEDVATQAENVLEKGEASRHFMGAVVLQQLQTPTGGIETRTIVDGQQRLTTLQLLIAAIQKVFEQESQGDPAVRLTPLVKTPHEYTGNNPEFAFKVWPTIYDQQDFRRAMENKPPSGEYKNSRIVLAYNYFKNMAQQWLQSFPEEENKRENAAIALEHAVRHCLELVVIDLGQSDDPNIIFETLNARGTPLLQSDMIKNRIMHKAGIVPSDDDEELSTGAAQLWAFGENWWREEIGRGHQRRPRIDTYLNNWLTLRNQAVTKNYDEFKIFSQYADKSEEAGTTIKEIAVDIAKMGIIYKHIEDNDWPDLESFLYRRKAMGIGGIIPVLLLLLSSEGPEPQLSRSITALESYIVRRMVCGLGATSYGQFFAGLVGKLKNSDLQHADETIVNYLKKQTARANIWPDDQDLLKTFQSEPLYWSMTPQRLNLILQGIEGNLRTAMSETQTVPRNLHIEHVMPQGWDQHWPLPANTEDKETSTNNRNRIIHSIGNLTLVNQRLNSALSNAPWEQKQETISKHSLLFLNKTLLENAPTIWDETAIIERGKQLHQAAIEVWPHAGSIK